MPAVTNTTDLSTFQSLAYYFQNGGLWNYLYSRLPGSQAYLQNPNNASGILYAYQTLGDPKNSGQYNSPYSMLIWYYTAYYANLYPMPSALQAVQANCQEISTIINVSLPNELTNSATQFVADNNSNQHIGRTIALNSYISAFNSLYGNLSCDTYLANVATQNAQSAAAAASNLATQNEVAAYTATQGTTVLGIPVTTTNIAIVVAILVATILGVIAMKKNKE